MNTQIYDEAGEWLVKHRTEALNAEEKRCFDAWLRQSPLHVRAYLELSAIWETLPALDGQSVASDELITRARVEGNVVVLPEVAHRDEARPATSPARRNWSRWWLASAAALLIAIGLSGWIASQRGVYATSVGEQRTIVLPDGSLIELNARSRVKVRYTDELRTVDLLAGQALFNVAKNPARPFVVHSDDTRVRAIGTQFDVYRKKTGTLVTVVEGRVAIISTDAARSGRQMVDERSAEPTADPAHGTRATAVNRALNARAVQPGELLLGAGEQVLMAQAAPSAPQPANVEAATAWTQQRLVFDYAPLKEVAEEFNRYNRRPLVIDDSSLHDFHVSGSFSSADPTLLLEFLRDQPEISVSETPSEIRISRRSVEEG